MRYLLTTLILAVALTASAGEVVSRRMSGWFNVTSQDGWAGKRYMDGNEIVAEEFDSNGDGRLDVWRFYRRGLLSSEERDLNGDGRVDFQSFWEPRQFRLMSVLRDTSSRGVNDLEIESTGRNRWEVREDRNRDGIADRVLIVNGPPDLFERLGMDLARQVDVIDNIPPEYWYELQSDDAYTRYITDYRRYSRGALTHYGTWDGTRVNWSRTPPDFVPPAPAPQVAVVPPTPGPVESYDGPGEAALGEPYTDPFADPFGGAPDYQDPFASPPPVVSDRTRYEGLPPGDSGARSLPARMRPPGANR